MMAFLLVILALGALAVIFWLPDDRHDDDDDDGPGGLRRAPVRVAVTARGQGKGKR
jgi:hypothetical protein